MLTHFLAIVISCWNHIIRFFLVSSAVYYKSASNYCSIRSNRLEGKARAHDGGGAFVHMPFRTPPVTLSLFERLRLPVSVLDSPYAFSLSLFWINHHESHFIFSRVKLSTGC